MSTIANGAIEMNTWAEEAFAEQDGAPKLSRAFGSDLYHGAHRRRGDFRVPDVLSR